MSHFCLGPFPVRVTRHGIKGDRNDRLGLERNSFLGLSSFPLLSVSLSLSRLVVAMTTLTNAYQRSLPLGILAIASVYASPREPTISPHKNKQEIEKRAVDRGHKSRPRIPAAVSLSPPRPFFVSTPLPCPCPCPALRYCANKALNNYFPAGDFSAGH